MNTKSRSYTTYNLVYQRRHPDLDPLFEEISCNESRSDNFPWSGTPPSGHNPKRNDRSGKRAVNPNNTNRSVRTVVLLVDFSTFVRVMQESISSIVVSRYRNL